jgi:hypothetical protein
LLTLISAKAAAVTAVAAVSLGGAAAAAYAGALPAPVQSVAHHIIGAPAASPSASPSPVGPNPTGAAAFGLCNAYHHALKHGTAAQKSVAFRNLTAAAGGASQVTSFCANVPHPGASPSHTPPATPSHPAKPAAQPTPSHPAKPAAHPTPSHP